MCPTRREKRWANVNIIIFIDLSINIPIVVYYSYHGFDLHYECLGGFGGGKRCGEVEDLIARCAIFFCAEGGGTYVHV